ncbi:MAG: hypothetical protein B6D46_05195 [Polyangiaceae bacterium UTPRO1]|jgi:uncharacterized protein YecE (DUF72 family)|nr:DUF72 domain-containing protein [Myxococcales bacterium]OQY67948.1 MAG: hypothetical protein B6D46_05195 [Polyangiaceae bacterium UTPRO1]
MADYWVGTSGYNYQEWKGSFYPEDITDKQMLAFYGRRFTSVEINYTFYRMPTNRILASWSAEVPERFRFTLKAPRRITHDQRLRSVEDTLASFCAIAKTLGPKLGPLLFQLPPFMKKDVELLEVFLHELPPGLQTVVEFRHASWLADDTYAVLRRFGAALCVADSEEHTTPIVVTAPFGYFRLRRSEYDDAALADWAGRVAAAGWSEAYVYFKHEEQGTGPAYAQRLVDLLERGGA